MKQISVLFIAILIISCNQAKREKELIKKATLIERSENFDWLLGKWKRLNEQQGKETFENWNKISDTEYSGIGFTMRDGDTIKQERIRLTKVNENWDLIVKVPEESESITFKGTDHSATEFTCENSDMDFPNKIKYWKSGDGMNAMVSGTEMEIAFDFKKIDD